MINESKNEPANSNTDPEIAPVEPKSETAAQVAYLGQSSKSLIILLCFEDALHLHSLKSVIKVPYLIFFLKIKFGTTHIILPISVNRGPLTPSGK